MKDINTKKRKIKYEGELDLAGHKLYCYVLEDGERGFSTRSTQEVLGIVDKDGKQKWSANRLGKFLSQKSLQPTFTEEKGWEILTQLSVMMKMILKLIFIKQLT